MLEKETGAKAGHEVMAMPGKQDASSHVSYLTPLSQVVVLLIHSAVPFFFSASAQPPKPSLSSVLPIFIYF